MIFTLGQVFPNDEAKNFLLGEEKKNNYFFIKKKNLLHI